MKHLKPVKKDDNVLIVFGEWFDRASGNTYYDADVHVGQKIFRLGYKYGYNAGDKQAINEALEECGYRVRHNMASPNSPYRHIRTVITVKLKRELHRHFEAVQIRSI